AAHGAARDRAEPAGRAHAEQVLERAHVAAAHAAGEGAAPELRARICAPVAVTGGMAGAERADRCGAGDAVGGEAAAALIATHGTAGERAIPARGGRVQEA